MTEQRERTLYSAGTTSAGPTDYSALSRQRHEQRVEAALGELLAMMKPTPLEPVLVKLPEPGFSQADILRAQIRGFLCGLALALGILIGYLWVQ